MSRILVVGGVNVDVHLFDIHEAPATAPLVAGRHVVEPGGKGANVARAASRLGAEVKLIARVGDDGLGRECIEAIREDDVNTDGVVTTTGAATGVVAIALERGHHRSLILASGANDLLSWDDVEPHAAELGPGDIVITQAEVPADTLARLVDHTAEAGAFVFLDPAPPERVTEALLSRVEVLTPDRAEAASLVGRADVSTLWPRLAARDLIALGARRVVIKLGEAGALLATGSEVVDVPAFSVDPVDETGAGDVFIAALATYRSEEVGWVEATRLANIASALSVAEVGVFFPDRATLDRAASVVM
ncbi:MAG: ribokinase [Acidimicrobiia bacterium]